MFSKTFYIYLIFSLQFSTIEEKVFQNSNLKHKTCAFSTLYRSRTPTTLLPILLFEGQTGHSCAPLRVIPSNQTFLLRKNRGQACGQRSQKTSFKNAQAHIILYYERCRIQITATKIRHFFACTKLFPYLCIK